MIRGEFIQINEKRKDRWKKNFNLKTIYVTNLHFKGAQHLDLYCFTRRIEFWNFFVTKASLTFQETSPNRQSMLVIQLRTFLGENCPKITCSSSGRCTSWEFSRCASRFCCKCSSLVALSSGVSVALHCCRIIPLKCSNLATLSSGASAARC